MSDTRGFDSGGHEPMSIEAQLVSKRAELLKLKHGVEIGEKNILDLSEKAERARREMQQSSSKLAEGTVQLALERQKYDLLSEEIRIKTEYQTTLDTMQQCDRSQYTCELYLVEMNSKLSRENRSLSRQLQETKDTMGREIDRLKTELTEMRSRSVEEQRKRQTEAAGESHSSNDMSCAQAHPSPAEEGSRRLEEIGRAVRTQFLDRYQTYPPGTGADRMLEIPVLKELVLTDPVADAELYDPRCTHELYDPHCTHKHRNDPETYWHIYGVHWDTTLRLSSSGTFKSLVEWHGNVRVSHAERPEASAFLSAWRRLGVNFDNMTMEELLAWARDNWKRFVDVRNAYNKLKLSGINGAEPKGLNAQQTGGQCGAKFEAMSPQASVSRRQGAIKRKLATSELVVEEGEGTGPANKRRTSRPLRTSCTTQPRNIALERYDTLFFTDPISGSDGTTTC